MNKREFMMASGAVLAGSSGASEVGEGPGNGVAGAARVLRHRMPDLATNRHASAWSAYVGHRFDVVGSAGIEVPLTLDEVVMNAADEGRLEQFTLVFRAPSAATLPAGTRVLAHRTGQRVAVYLDPTRSSASAAAYRADFSLLASAAA